LVEWLVGTGMVPGEVAGCCRIVAAVALLAESDLGSDSLSASASLLRIPEKELRNFLSKAEMSVGGSGRERVFRARNERESSTLQASLAQELYAALFSWLTRLVARGIAPPHAATDGNGTSDGGRTLGLLDLYGFEVFASNGFEQFLINYCNERLQQLFNRQVFTCEAQEYSDEGLDCNGQWRSIVNACKLPALALLEGEAGVCLGVFSVINDRSRIGFEESAASTSGGGAPLADSIAAACGSHSAFCRAVGRDANRTFGIRHFAGEVFYEAAHFTRKNASAHRPDIVAFLRKHGCHFMHEVLGVDGSDVADPLDSLGGQFPSTSVDRHLSVGSSCSSPTSAGSRPRRKLFGRTLISVFQQELNELCAALDSRHCRHVRCLRPNDEQAPLVFDDPSVLRQCRYSGLLEATRIRRQGYAHRRGLRNFAARYAILLGSREARRTARHATADNAAAACHALCQAATRGFGTEDARIGRTKVFLRERALDWFEGTRRVVAAKLISAALVGNHTRKQFRHLRRMVLILQARVRGCVARRFASRLWALRELERFEAQRQRTQTTAAKRLQTWWRRRINLWQQRALHAEAAAAAHAAAVAAAAAAARREQEARARREREEQRELRRRREAERREQDRQQQLSFGVLEKPQSWANKCDDKENMAPKASTTNPASSPASKTGSPELGKKGSRGTRSQRDAQQKKQGQTIAGGGRSKKVASLGMSKTPPVAMERRRAASNQQRHVATPRSVNRQIRQDFQQQPQQQQLPQQPQQQSQKHVVRERRSILQQVAEALDYLKSSPEPLVEEDLASVQDQIQSLHTVARPSSPANFVEPSAVGVCDNQPRMLQRHPSYPVPISWQPQPRISFDSFADQVPCSMPRCLTRSLSARAVVHVASPRGAHRSPSRTPPAGCSARALLPICSHTPLRTVCSHGVLPVLNTLNTTPRHYSSPVCAPMLPSSPSHQPIPQVPAWAWHTKPAVVGIARPCHSVTVPAGRPEPVACASHKVVLALPTPCRRVAARSPSKYAAPANTAQAPLALSSVAAPAAQAAVAGAGASPKAPTLTRVLSCGHSATGSFRVPLGTRSAGSSVTAAVPAPPGTWVPANTQLPGWGSGGSHRCRSPSLSRCCSPTGRPTK